MPRGILIYIYIYIQCLTTYTLNFKPPSVFNNDHNLQRLRSLHAMIRLCFEAVAVKTLDKQKMKHLKAWHQKILELPSLKLTASLPLKIGLNSPKGNEKVFQPSIFGCELSVSGRVVLSGIFQYSKYPKNKKTNGSPKKESEITMLTFWMVVWYPYHPCMVYAF